MKDMFGREIKVDDIVVYATRRSSTQYMMIARVLKVTEKNVRVLVVAGNDHEWRNGHFGYNSETKQYERTEMTGYEASLTASNNVMISNGIDVGGIQASLVEAQRKALESRRV